MLMATSISPAIPSSPPRRFSILTTTNAKFVKVPALCCLSSGGQTDGEMSLEESSNVELEMKNKEIWRLFKEAQKNILYLNKQRLKAVAELHKANREKQLLVDKIEQLENENRRASGKDNLALCWALLLRIDAMVLGGMISPAEATDLRRMVMDGKVSVANVFSDMLQKRDAELLAELHHFSEGSKK